MSHKEKRTRQRSSRPILLGITGFILVIAFLSIVFLYEKSSDPIRIEIIDNDTKTGKVLYKITHLNDGRIDYVFNFTESMGTTSFDKMP